MPSLEGTAVGTRPPSVTCCSWQPARQSVVVLMEELSRVRTLLACAFKTHKIATRSTEIPIAVCIAAEPCLVLSPDCKHLAVKEPCSQRICLLAAHDSFKEVLTTLVPLPVSQDGEVVADTVLSCSWSADSKLLLVACKSSAVYLFDRCVAAVTRTQQQHKHSFRY